MGTCDRALGSNRELYGYGRKGEYPAVLCC